MIELPDAPCRLRVKARSRYAFVTQEAIAMVALLPGLLGNGHQPPPFNPAVNFAPEDGRAPSPRGALPRPDVKVHGHALSHSQPVNA